MNKVLLMLDVQNTYYSALGFAGVSAGQARVKHESLQEFILTKLNLTRETAEMLSYAYVVKSVKYKKGPRFFSILESLGFIIRDKDYDPNDEWTNGSVVGEMQLDLPVKAAKFDTVVVISGNGLLIPAFKSVKDNNPKVKCVLAAFPGTIHGRYIAEDIVDDIIYLDADVVVHLGERNGSKKEVDTTKS